MQAVWRLQHFDTSASVHRLDDWQCAKKLSWSALRSMKFGRVPVARVIAVHDAADPWYAGIAPPSNAKN